MVRDKKGVKSQDRLNQIFNDEVRVVNQINIFSDIKFNMLKM